MSAKKQHMVVDLKNEAVQAVVKSAEITGRSNDEALSDAINTYLWLLFKQFTNRKILVDGQPGHEPEVVIDLIKKPAAAEEYFKEIHWIEPKS
jgi:hypothetical protein